MTDTGTTTPRERYRAQLKDEIKKGAWAQIATAGTSALSLNAIARQLGLSGPALYRYFANRDELITALISDAYRDLADTFQAAAAAGADLAGLAHTLRGWALADPQRYLLVYGTPVPGYSAPDDVTAIASEIMATLLDACAPLTSGQSETPFETYLESHRQWADGHPAPATALHRALTFWTRMHGVLSLELAGHFNGLDFDPDQLFIAELETLMGC
jgi:AcrR family transcriptional regulator